MVVQGGRRGSGIVQNSEQGWQLAWRRPLAPGFEGRVPMFDLDLNIAFLKATVTGEKGFHLGLFCSKSAKVQEAMFNLKIAFRKAWVTGGKGFSFSVLVSEQGIIFLATARACS